MECPIPLPSPTTKKYSIDQSQQKKPEVGNGKQDFNQMDIHISSDSSFIIGLCDQQVILVSLNLSQLESNISFSSFLVILSLSSHI